MYRGSKLLYSPLALLLVERKSRIWIALSSTASSASVFYKIRLRPRSPGFLRWTLSWERHEMLGIELRKKNKASLWNALMQPFATRVSQINNLQRSVHRALTTISIRVVACQLSANFSRTTSYVDLAGKQASFKNIRDTIVIGICAISDTRRQFNSASVLATPRPKPLIASSAILRSSCRTHITSGVRERDLHKSRAPMRWVV